MAQAKKVVKAFGSKKVDTKKPVISDKTIPTSSTEIDDLFSILSTSKKSSTSHEPTEKKDPEVQQLEKSGELAISEEVTVSELEDLVDDDEEFDEVGCDEEKEDLVKGVAYDHKKDDIFPGTAATTTVTSKDSICDSDFFDSRGLKRKTRPLTQDGLPIFTPKELKIGMGGGTDLCPFDCNCCY